jgi:phosphatidylserine decarboxylase
MRWQTLYEGRWIFAVLFALAAGCWFARPWLGSWPLVLPALLILFCINFFRDPDRPVSADPRDVVSAADGLVTHVEETEEKEVLHGTARRISVFLSVFDVHTNKAPIAGKVTYVQHHAGLFLDARDPDCATKNEGMTWGIEGGKATLVVRQLTGAIARRIVPWAKVGDTLEKGGRFGMIRFGSRTDVFLPMDAEILVKPGDRVKGGGTVIARLK